MLEGRDVVEPSVVDWHLGVGHEGSVERLHRDEEEGEEVPDYSERG